MHGIQRVASNELFRPPVDPWDLEPDYYIFRLLNSWRRNDSIFFLFKSVKIFFLVSILQAVWLFHLINDGFVAWRVSQVLLIVERGRRGVINVLQAVFFVRWDFQKCNIFCRCKIYAVSVFLRIFFYVVLSNKQMMSCFFFNLKCMVRIPYRSFFMLWTKVCRKLNG